MKGIFLLFFLALSSPVLLHAQSAASSINRGEDYYADKKFNEAVANFTKAISAARGNTKQLSVAYAKRAFCYDKLKQYQKGIIDANRAIAANAANGEGYWARGLLYDNLKKYKEAIADYSHAMVFYKTDSTNIAILLDNRASDEIELEHYDKAIADDSQALQYDPKNDDAYWNRGIAYNRLKQYELAIKDYKKALVYQDDKENISKLYDNIAMDENKLEKYVDAISSSSNAIYFNANNADAYWHRGIAYGNRGDYQLAANDYSKTMEYYQQDKDNLSILYNNRARNELNMHQYEKALQDNAKSLQLDSTNKGAYWTCGSIHNSIGNHQKAITAYRQAIRFYKESDEDLSTLHNNCANNAYYANDMVAAMHECNMAIELNANSAAAYFTRGKLYLKKLNNGQAAKKDFETVIAIDSAQKTVSYIFSLFYTGKADAALSHMNKRLLTINNEHELLSDYYNMACLLSLINKPAEATVYLKKALENGYSKQYAFYDDDLNNIRQLPEYIALVGTFNK